MVIFEPLNATAELYPKDMTRAPGNCQGRKSSNHRASFSLEVHVRLRSPFNPWTATRLWLKGKSTVSPSPSGYILILTKHTYSNLSLVKGLVSMPSFVERGVNVNKPYLLSKSSSGRGCGDEELTYSTDAYIRHILPVCTPLLTNQVSRIPSQSSCFPVVKTLERLNNIGPQAYAVIGYGQTSV
jgi:hypothetical protein